MSTPSLRVPSTSSSGVVVKDQLPKNDRRGAQAISFFNNKGGVGKTTLVANLAAQMALRLNYKVLVVDADPQCNVTQYMLSDEEFIDTYQGDPAGIYSIIHPLSTGRGYSEKLPTRRVSEFGCDIVVGDPRLALKEDLLAQDWRDAKAGGTRGLRTTFVFSDLINKASEYDFVFFDMGPSLGAINRSILLAANFFVVPMSIDIFSIWAIKNIGEAVRIWKRDLENGIKLAEDPNEVPNADSLSRLQFLGYVTQQHKERRVKGEGENRRIVEAYDAINKRLPKEVEEKLGALYPVREFEPHLGDIKHLASLAPKSQTLHKPMINVSIRGSYTTLRKQAREIYDGISTRFLDNLSKALASTKQ